MGPGVRRKTDILMTVEVCSGDNGRVFYVCDVSLVSIAREIGSSPSALLRHWAAAKQMPVVVLKVAYGEGKQQSFVRLKYRNPLLSFRPAMWQEQQRSAKRKRRLAQKQQRLKVLQEVNQGHITKKRGALELGISVGHVYQLLAQWRAGDDNPLRRRLRGTTAEPRNAGSGERASRGTISGEKAGEAAA